MRTCNAGNLPCVGCVPRRSNLRLIQFPEAIWVPEKLGHHDGFVILTVASPDEVIAVASKLLASAAIIEVSGGADVWCRVDAIWGH